MVQKVIHSGASGADGDKKEGSDKKEDDKSDSKKKIRTRRRRIKAMTKRG